MGISSYRYYCTISNNEKNSYRKENFIDLQVIIKEVTSFSANLFQDSIVPGSKGGFSKEEFNYSRMGIIVLNILGDVMYDRLQLDGHNVHTRREYDITKLYNEHRKLNIHRPSNSNNRRYGPWGGTWHDIQNTDTAIGDDIERIRLTRNELQHSSTYELHDTRFTELCNIMHDLLGRFDKHNKPSLLYSESLKEILAKAMSDEEVINFRQHNELKIGAETALQVEVLHELHQSAKKKTGH